ncbi:MAG: HlyD family efflux transporter periplasmic adaptor subunit [Desulfocapsaceae bacterium]|nr:HlyD family efflux transporter periplasmic adaptor subunit [Desulfocapsaceae bacterium]
MKINFDGTKKENPSYEGGMKVPYASGKRALAAWKWYAVVIITASPLLFFLIKIILSSIFISAPGVVSLQKVDLNCPETGSIAKINVKPGDTITAGFVVVTISDPALEGQASILRSQLEELMQKKREKPPDDLLKENIKMAQAVCDRRLVHLGEVRHLFSEGAATAAELDLALGQYNQAQVELLHARREYAGPTRAAGADPVLESSITRVTTEIELVEEKRSKLEFKSPVSGLVSSVFVEENQSIAKGARVARLVVSQTPSLKAYSLKAYVDPANINYVKKGRQVTLKLPGHKILTGYVASDPETAKPIPAELSDSLYEAKQTIEVDIAVSSPLPQEFQIDGLPITVYFGFLWL